MRGLARVCSDACGLGGDVDVYLERVRLLSEGPERAHRAVSSEDERVRKLFVQKQADVVNARHGIHRGCPNSKMVRVREEVPSARAQPPPAPAPSTRRCGDYAGIHIVGPPDDRIDNGLLIFRRPRPRGELVVEQVEVVAAMRSSWRMQHRPRGGGYSYSQSNR